MEFRQLGKSGLKVPELCFGAGTFGGGNNEFFKAFGLQLGPQVAEDHLYAVVDVLSEVAAETGKTVPQIALNWLLRRPSISSLIIGARNEEQLKQNLGAVDWKLDAEQIARLDQVTERPRIYPYWHQSQFTERNPVPV